MKLDFVAFAALRVAGGAGVAGECTRGLNRVAVNKMPVTLVWLDFKL